MPIHIICQACEAHYEAEVYGLLVVWWEDHFWKCPNNTDLFKGEYTQKSTLECFWCPAKFRWFDMLAEHVKAVHLKKEREHNMLLDQKVLSQSSLVTHPFLKPRNIPGKGVNATIMDMRQADASMPYSDYLLDVKIGKTIFTQGLRERGEDMMKLAKAFGLDTDKWKGKEIACYVEAYVSESSGKESMIVRVSPAKSQK